MSFPYTFTHNGRSFTASIEADDSQDAPWEREDGHGPVRVVRVRGGLAHAGVKRPGERLLHSDGWTCWLYDWQAACKIARRDGWNAAPYDAPGRIERAVSADFERMRGWLADDWHYVGVIVSADDGESERESLWGIESDADDYLQEVAHELAERHPTPYVHVLGATC